MKQVYNSVCLDELNSGALCFLKPSDFRKPNVYGQSALHDWDYTPAVHLGNDGDRGGRSAMKGSKVDWRRLDLVRQAILKKDDLMRSGIYAIVNTCNGHIYVGQSKCLWNRRHSHFRDLEAGKHINRYLQNAYSHYGKGSFRFAVIEFVDLFSELDDKEQYWIENIKPEYNIARNVFENTNRNRTDPVEDVLPDYRKEGESFDRPAWHAWVYGGAKNPLLHGRKPEAKTP